MKRTSAFSALVTVAVLFGGAQNAQAACSLAFTSPGNGAKLSTAGVTVYGSGSGDATTGDYGTVTATLNGTRFFTYSGSFTAVVSFFQSAGVGVTLRPGANYLHVAGSVGGCSASDSMTLYYDTTSLIPRKNKGTGAYRSGPPSCAGNPINFALGNKVQEEEDYLGPTQANPLRLARSFNSADGYWRHSYATRLKLDASEVILIHPSGLEQSFARSGSTITAPPDELGTLSQDGPNWLYIDPDNIRYEFNSNGRLSRQTTPYGLYHSLSYATDGGITVTDNFGNSFFFTEDAHFRPGSLSAPGMSIAYTFDTRSRLLTAVKTTGSDVGTRSYHYEDSTYPQFLTGITDERNVRYARYAYDSLGRATSSEHAGGADRVAVAYDTAGTTTVTNALGKQTVYHYTLVNGVKRISRIQGEPSANCPASNASFTYDSRGLLASQTDNRGTLTRYTYNARGLETSRSEAVGSAQERVVSTEWHPSLPLPLRVTEPGRTLSFTYDTQGRMLTRTIAD